MQYKKYIIRTFLFIALLLLVRSASAQDYPFVLPDTVSATLNVDTQTTEKALNNLLGYNYWRFKTDQDKELATALAPVSVRFSEGNNYDWETDGFQNDSYDNGDYESTIETLARGVKWGYPQMLDFHNKYKVGRDDGFDVLFNFSVGFKSAESNMQRLLKYENDGLKITDVEIGNEYFWKIFRSNTTAEASDQVKLFHALADSLHKMRPDIKLSIPLGWRTSQAGYNTTIMGNKTYFDAISVHKYVGADPDKPEESDLAYSNILTARLSLIKDVDFVRNQAPGKPVWLTEWNVDGKESGKWAAALGATDVYLYLFANQDKYHRACWFSAAAAKNPFVAMDPVKRYDPKYPFEKTISGAMFEIVRSVFKDAEMYDGTMTTDKLTTTMGSIDAVNARVVSQDGMSKVLAVNLTDKPVDFVLKLDGELYDKSFIHNAMHNRNLNDAQTVGIDENPLTLVKQGSGRITLPPLSINVIDLVDEVEERTLPYVKLTSPLAGAIYKLGDEIAINATASDNDGTVTKVRFFINDTLYTEDTSAPYASLFTPSKTGAYNIEAIVFDNDSNQTAVFVNIDVINQAPYLGFPSTIPGTIEAEDYDMGGEGLAYHDNETTNLSGQYRQDGVDIGITPEGGFSIGYTSPNEWLEYTVEVAQDGIYNVDVIYSSKSTGVSLGMELPEADNVLFTGLTSDASGDWNTYTSATQRAIALSKGQHVLRVNIEGRGWNFDKMIFKETDVSGTGDHTYREMGIFPNPSESGVFQLSERMSWKVYALSGALILEGDGTSVNLTSADKGIYIFRSSGVFTKLIYQ